MVAQTYKWFEQKNMEIGELNREDYEAGRPPTHGYVSPEFMLTQGAIVSLAVANLVDRYGYNPDLKLDVYPRGLEGYNDPNHPNSTLSYLIKCSFSDRVVVYIATSSGKVTEHFEIRDSEVTPLPAPNLLAPEETYSDSVPGQNVLHLRFTE